MASLAPTAPPRAPQNDATGNPGKGRESPRPPHHGHRTSDRRLDIQGLRAIAVIAVILNHLLAWPGGGFIGVDVFFVISGFLITGLLCREHRDTGRISFLNFYRRRVRRIIPVATVVIVVTVLASSLLYLPSRAAAIGVDAIWALFFSMNWHLAVVGTNYWANDTGVSPLQHYWSLAVEEQFYVIWPLLLFAVLSMGLKLRWAEQRRLNVLLFTLSLVAAISFVWATVETATQATWAYFSTFSRGWELGIGAILAVSTSTWLRIPGKFRPYIAWTGLAGILASVFVVSESNAFPAPWAMLPVASTALVIIAGTGGTQRGLAPLTNRLTAYIGTISYSLYLWHFPVLILLGSVFGEGALFYLIALTVMVGLSVFSYHEIEEPIRTSNWLSRKSPKKAPSRAPKASRGLPRRRQLSLVVLLSTVTAVLLAMLLQNGLTASRSAGQQVTSEVTVSAPKPGGEPSPTASPEQVDQAKRINAALSARKFPALSPSIDDLGIDKWAADIGKDPCAIITSTNSDACGLGEDTGKKILILGDSYAIAWSPGIKKAFQGSEWNVKALSMGQCPAASVSVTRDGGRAYPECDEHREWTIRQIEKIKPAYVIIGDSESTMFRLKSEYTGASAQAEIEQGLEATLAAIAPYAQRTVVLTPPPGGAALQDCATRLSTPSDCVENIRSDWKFLAKTMGAASEKEKAHFVDTRSWFCSSGGRCPSFTDTTPIRVDTGHLSIQYAELISPLLKAGIVGE